MYVATSDCIAFGCRIPCFLSVDTLELVLGITSQSATEPVSIQAVPLRLAVHVQIQSISLA